MNDNDQSANVANGRNRIASWMVRRLIVFSLVAVGGLYMFSFSGRVPENIGAVDGKLAACPKSPNCVCSQASDTDKKMPSIMLSATGDELTPIERIKAVVAEHFSEATLVTEKENYLHYEFKSFIFRFVDDVEFLVDADQQQIDFRSASRVGHSDLGANAKRMRKITSLLEQ